MSTNKEPVNPIPEVEDESVNSGTGAQDPNPDASKDSESANEDADDKANGGISPSEEHYEDPMDIPFMQEGDDNDGNEGIADEWEDLGGDPQDSDDELDDPSLLRFKPEFLDPNGFPSPYQFARAVFPDPVYGPPGQNATSHKQALATSHKEALIEIMTKLSNYAFSPTLYHNSTNLRKHRSGNNKEFAIGHQAYQSTRTAYIYCAKCLNDSKVIDEFRCCVIASVTYAEGYEDKKRRQGVRAECTVQEIFPHSSECTVPPMWRRNTRMTKAENGTGYEKLPFPVEECIGITFDQIIRRINRRDDNKHMGESIPHCLYIHCCALSPHFPSSKCYISVAISDHNIYVAISHHNISVAYPQHNFIRCKSATQIFCCTSATLRFCNTQLAHNGLCSSHMHYFPFTYLFRYQDTE